MAAFHTLILSSLKSRASTPADRLIKAEKSAKYLRELWFFLACVICFVVCVRVLRSLYTLFVKPSLDVVARSAPRDQDIERPNLQPAARPSRFFSALATAFNIISFRCYIPIVPYSSVSVAELVFIGGYITAMLIFLLVDTRDLETMFWEDRAASLAASQMPLIVALAGKNNIISFMTGIGHEKLNVLHRAAARTCLLLIWMHAIGRISTGLPAIFDFSHGWMRAGAVSLVAFTLVTILSVAPIRHVAFEFFLVSHIILVAVSLVFGYVHTNGAGWDSFIWPAMMIWALDRVLRLARLIWNNRLWNRQPGGYSKATVQLISRDTIRLTLRRKIAWKPGQHAYLMLPKISNIPTEAHPFTIATIPRDSDTDEDNEVVFLIKGRTGFTRRLRDHTSQNGTGDVAAFLDGPYGNPPDLSRFTTCVLIAGGSGISYTLPLLLNIIRRNIRKKASAVRRVVFIWVARDTESLPWISDAVSEAFSSEVTNLTIDFQVYITSATHPIYDTPILSASGTTGTSSLQTLDVEKKTGYLAAYNGSKIQAGRPDIRKCLEDEVTTSSGPVSVDVAGPAALSSAVRKALRSDFAGPRAVLNGLPPVTLHIEMFGMVKS